MPYILIILPIEGHCTLRVKLESKRRFSGFRSRWDTCWPEKRQEENKKKRKEKIKNKNGQIKLNFILMRVYKPWECCVEEGFYSVVGFVRS